MKILALIAVGLLALLSLAAGGAKLALMPQEVQFFGQLGLSQIWLYPLGAIQVLGALACALPKTRRLGTSAIGIGFAISSIMLFLTGETVLGGISLFVSGLCGAVQLAEIS